MDDGLSRRFVVTIGNIFILLALFLLIYGLLQGREEGNAGTNVFVLLPQIGLMSLFGVAYRFAGKAFPNAFIMGTALGLLLLFLHMVFITVGIPLPWAPQTGA